MDEECVLHIGVSVRESEVTATSACQSQPSCSVS